MLVLLLTRCCCLQVEAAAVTERRTPKMQVHRGLNARSIKVGEPFLHGVQEMAKNRTETSREFEALFAGALQRHVLRQSSARRVDGLRVEGDASLGVFLT